MKTDAKLLIVDLAQSILIFIGVAAFYFITTGKSVNPPASKIVPVIPQEKLEEMKEVILELEDGASWQSLFCGVMLQLVLFLISY